MRLTSIVSLVLAGGLACSTGMLEAQQPDNTKINERDRQKTEKTADQAKETTSDREIMQKIRKAVVDDKSLSTYGPVHTDDERKNIEAKAIEVAGAGNVTNQLSVKADK
jgi:hyperosmotically inducible protein